MPSIIWRRRMDKAGQDFANILLTHMYWGLNQRRWWERRCLALTRISLSLRWGSLSLTWRTCRNKAGDIRISDEEDPDSLEETDEIGK